MGQNGLPVPLQDIRRGHVPQRLVVPTVVVEPHEVPDGGLQILYYLVGNLVHVPFQSLVIALQLPVGLRVEGCGQDVLDPHQAQVVPKGPRDVA